MRCSGAQKRLLAYHDGELSAGLSRRLERHLQSCEECSRILQRIRQADEAAGDSGLFKSLEGPPHDDKYWGSFTARVLDRVEREAATRAPRKERTPGPWDLLVPRLAPALSVALVIVVAAGVFMKVREPAPVPTSPVIVTELGQQTPSPPVEEGRPPAREETGEASPAVIPEKESSRSPAPSLPEKEEAMARKAAAPSPDEDRTVGKTGGEGQAEEKKAVAVAAGDRLEPPAAVSPPPQAPRREVPPPEPPPLKTEARVPAVEKIQQASPPEDGKAAPPPAPVAAPVPKVEVQESPGPGQSPREAEAVETPAPSGPSDDAVAALPGPAVTEEDPGRHAPELAARVAPAVEPPEPVKEAATPAPPPVTETLEESVTAEAVVPEVSASGDTARQSLSAQPPTYRSPADQLAHARNLADLRLYRESERVLDDLLSQKPPSPVGEEASLLLVRVLASQNRVGEAQDVLDDAQRRYPQSEKVQTFQLGGD